MRRSNLLQIPVLGTVALLLILGVRVAECEELQTEVREVARGEAKSVMAVVKLTAGSLEISGGAEKLVEGEFSYNYSDLKPEVEYTVRDMKGRLVIRQPEMRGEFPDDARNNWNIRLSDGVPIEMKIEVGAGKTQFDFADVVLEELSIDVGAGEVRLAIPGVSTLHSFSVEIGAGHVTADLTGDWNTDLKGSIKSALGAVTLKLPKAAGIRMKAKTGIGSVHSGELRKRNGEFVNELFGKSDVTLDLKVQVGLGEIEVEMSE